MPDVVYSQTVDRLHKEREVDMVHPRVVDDQLRAIGASFKFFGRPEVRELCNLITPDEVIAQAVNGYYDGGFALLVVTNHRVLLIDRKTLFMTLEDIRFDMISEVDFNHKLFTATARIYTPNKSLIFTSWSHGKLRQIVHIIQERVLESRQLAQMSPQEQFAKFAEVQMAASAKPVQSVSQKPHVSLTPALAHTAIQGATLANEPKSSPFGFMTNNFVSPLPRNPYLKTPLKTFRKFRNF